VIVKIGIVLLASLLIAGNARAACVVENKATIPLEVTAGAITMPVQVNGATGTFILDTGAQRSVVTEEAVHRLGLARDEWVGTTMQGVGGIESRPNADPRSLTLGGVPLVRRTVTHDNSLTVGILPRTRVGNILIDGVLGRDFLSLFDLDIDVPNHRLALYQVHDCAGRFLPWQGGYTALPVTLPAENALIVPVMLDSTPVNFANDPVDEVSGLGTHVVTMHRHTFRSLRVGGQTADSPVIWVAPIHLTPIVDMLLGADWLADRRVWISFATRQLFVSAP
jgi:Aspartyl protease